jgi:hypothetical protein
MDSQTQNFPFDEDIDLFENESLMDEQDFDFPSDEQADGVSKPFLIASGVMVVAILLGVCALVLAIMGDNAKDRERHEAETRIARTNFVIPLVFDATQTRQAVVDKTLTATTMRFFGDSTNTAIAAATGTHLAIEDLLNGSRTALAASATFQRETLDATLTQGAITPSPVSLQAQILDANGNAVTGITIELYQANK